MKNDVFWDIKTQIVPYKSDDNNKIIQFSSIIYYLCAEATATRPITDTEECRYT
jgi:hypothetical protein